MVGLFSYDRGGLLGGADGFLVSLDISVPIMGGVPWCSEYRMLCVLYASHTFMSEGTSTASFPLVEVCKPCIRYSSSQYIYPVV